MNQPVNHEWSEFTCNSGKLENYNTDNTWNLISGRPGTLVLVLVLQGYEQGDDYSILFNDSKLSW